MTWVQFFLLMMVVYLAPHVVSTTARVAATIFGLMAILIQFKVL